MVGLRLGDKEDEHGFPHDDAQPCDTSTVGAQIFPCHGTEPDEHSNSKIEPSATTQSPTISTKTSNVAVQPTPIQSIAPQAECDAYSVQIAQIEATIQQYHHQYQRNGHNGHGNHEIPDDTHSNPETEVVLESASAAIEDEPTSAVQDLAQPHHQPFQDLNTTRTQLEKCQQELENKSLEIVSLKELHQAAYWREDRMRARCHALQRLNKKLVEEKEVLNVEVVRLSSVQEERKRCVQEPPRPRLQPQPQLQRPQHPSHARKLNHTVSQLCPPRLSTRRLDSFKGREFEGEAFKTVPFSRLFLDKSRVLTDVKSDENKMQQRLEELCQSFSEWSLIS